MPTAPETAVRPGWQELLGLLVLTCAGAWLRWCQRSQFLWLDELTTAWVVQGAWFEIPERAMLNNLSPLYYGLVWLSTRAAGLNEAGLRLPTLIAGVLCIPAACFTARRLTGSAAAACCAGLIAVQDQSFLFYSTEARPYALIQLLALLNIAWFSEYLQRPSVRTAVLLAVNAAVMFYLHYTSLLFVGVNILLLGVASLRGDLSWHEVRRSLAIAVGLWLVLVLPSVVQITWLVGHRDILGSFVVPLSLEETLRRFQIVSYTVLALTIAALASDTRKPASAAALPRERDGQSVLMLFLWFVVPLLMVLVLSKARVIQINLDRYVIACSSAGILIPACGTCLICATTASRRRAFLLICLLLLTRAPQLVRTALESNPRKDDRPWHDLVDSLNRHAPDNFPVYVRSGLVEGQMLAGNHSPLLESYLLAPVTTVYPLRPELLSRTRPGYDPQELVNTGLDTDFIYVGHTGIVPAVNDAVRNIAERRQLTGTVRTLCTHGHLTALVAEFR